MGSCVLQYTETIIDCFQSNRDLLPSPPTSLAVKMVSNSEVLIKWDLPKKNAHKVEGYRIYWHEVDPNVEHSTSYTAINGNGMHRVDTREMSIRIRDLRPNVVYELMIKAGNQNGSSILTEPITFQLGKNISEELSGSSSTGAVLGIFAGIVVIALVASAILLYKRRILMKPNNTNGGVSFENPSYLREVNMENVQVS